MPPLKRYWGSIKTRPIAAAMVFSVAAHAAAFAVILSHHGEAASPPMRVVMIDLTKTPPQSPDLQALSAIPPVLTPLEPVKAIERTLDLNRSVRKASLARGFASNDERGGSSAPIRLAMLKVGMQSTTALKPSTTALQFDESQVKLASPGSADGILAATNRSALDGGGGNGRGILFGIASGMAGGPSCGAP